MTDVLVDTSVWVEHFRRKNERLAKLLAMDNVLTHSMIIGELACGTPPDRERTLADLGVLRQCNRVDSEEVLAFINDQRLYGLGCGLVDISLLASTLITSGTMLWTLDKRLGALATRFGVEFKVD